MTALNKAKFSLGQTVATPSALTALDQAAVNALTLLLRHQTGDWGNLPAEDWQSNEDAVKHGWRILSNYPLTTGERIWIITEADRSSTTLLLPEEY
ncbi:hypothetical protein [Deefgea salmonis]|uniref:Type I restriction endonuclease subunit M n=1 Tax=Deefgea salmonis TaxID=2875502 RepID=A0ABS8BJA2_9NEIS|nr:hypothetical protein [Deefgea salmonis]MCB5195689.1 hypothetical protein [Deefgea salmonis]